MLNHLKKGDDIFFHGIKMSFEVVGVRENFIVARRVDGKQYTIVDTKAGKCGPHDRVFHLYDLGKLEDVENLLDDLVNKTYGIQLSRRHTANIQDVIDLEKTLEEA